MPTRVVVTGVDASGTSRVRRDGPEAVEVPPAREDVVRDPAAVVAEVGAELPGLLQAAVPDAGPGMHRTRTVDLLTVVRGRVLLLLDDGIETELGPGDCVVQQGSVQAWRACSDEPCLLAGVMVSTG